MKRRLKIAALVFGVLVLCLLSFLAWVIYTEAGLRFAVNRLPEKMGKVTLRIEDVRGTIAGGFSARLRRRRSRAHTRARRGRQGARELLAAARRTHLGAQRAVGSRAGRRQAAPEGPPEDAAEVLAAAAEHQHGTRLDETAASSSRPTAGASNSTMSAAQASSGTRPSAYSKATSSTASCTRAPSASCARRIRPS